MIVRTTSPSQADAPASIITGREPLARWRCSADQFLLMVRAGVLDESDRVELIDGTIVCISPAEVSHNCAVSNLTQCLMGVMVSHEVLVQCTVRLDDFSVVDPDLTVLRRPNNQDEGRLPEPSDVLLLIEVAHRSLSKDLGLKQKLYASAAISEYWVADIENRALIVHRQPNGERYDSVQTLRGDQSVSPLSIEGLSVTPTAVFAGAR